MNPYVSLATLKSSGVFNVTVEWLKDGQEGDVIGNKLQVIEVGTDTDGD